MRKNLDTINKISVLTNILSKNVYPEIANELLFKDGFLLSNNSLIRCDDNERIIGDSVTFDKVIEENEKLKSNEELNTNNVIQGLFDKI